jgi:hypothetical protein
MSGQAPYVGAVVITEVVCPPWCIEPQSEHLNELPAWEGRAIHHSAEQAGDGWEVQHSTYTFADGQLADGEAPLVRATVKVEHLTVDEARRFAEAVLAACDEAAR